jgi:hypothetical protein
MRIIFLGFIFILVSITGFGQNISKTINYFATPILIDSSSSIIIPVQYDINLMNSSKFYYGEFYANIVFYNFKNDSSKRLFKNDTFIKGFMSEYNYYNQDRKYNLDNISSQWIFYFVKSFDYSKNGKIDSDDPYILYVSDKNGNGLKAITPVDENAVSINIYNKQGFALIKMQRDLDKDFDFENSDKDYYYIRLDLNTLKFGNKIEIKNN